jgi:glucose-1-phosphate thymidylyltransferase
MKGIILAAGKGTRLHPASSSVSKILLPVYDKPMIYYPLCTLMTAGIRDILVITSEDDMHLFKRVLGNGSQFGVEITYMVQYVQRGIADAFLIAKDYIGEDRAVLVLGDNIFYGDKIADLVREASRSDDAAIVFGHKVKDPKRFGVVEFDHNGKVLSLEEKPKEPKSDYAVVGLYFYDNTVSYRAKMLSPSARGELEVTDLNITYLEDGLLSVKLMDDDSLWIDTGTFDSLLEASSIISDIQRSGILVSSPEMIALDMGWIDREQLVSWLKRFKRNEYYEVIWRIVGE